MATTLCFNGRKVEVATVEALGQALDGFDAVLQFELWATVTDGPSLCMLRNGAHAWLMYLRHEGDAGFNSVGRAERSGTEKYILGNGQVDEYPLAWCIEVGQCYKAIAYFHVNDGAKPTWIHWHEN